MNIFLDPAILFFLVGVLAGTVRSNLEIPQPIARFLSLYLLMALGLKGGFALAKSGITAEVASDLACAMLLALAVPLAAYALLRRLLEGFDAAAVAATYGSVSAVTFVTAVQMLDTQGVEYGGHMAAAMALMESPAIVLAVLFANGLRMRASRVAVGAGGTATLPLADRPSHSVGSLLRESFTDGGQILLLGAMVVGMLSGEAGRAAMQPFSGDLFKGMLAFFLLDMGLLTARSLPGLRSESPALLVYAVAGPVVHAAVALSLAAVTGMSVGNGMLLMVLAASASYIAVPAVIRHAIPEAKPSLYIGMPLGVTFPFNILVGLPVYLAAARTVL